MIKKIIGRLRKPVLAVPMSNEDLVSHLSDKAIGLFDHIKVASDELDLINSELHRVADEEALNLEKEIEAHKARVDKITKNKEKAVNEIRMNNKVKEKLADFIR